jgi:methylthioribose-1-phosphate isomerase
MHVKTVDWAPGGALRIIDQTRLPAEEIYLDLDTFEGVIEAIRTLRVRGAPAIGVAAAMGLAASLRRWVKLPRERFLSAALSAADAIGAARPTAVNLGWAMERMRKAARGAAGDAAGVFGVLLKEAQAIWREDQAMCRAMGEAGQTILPVGRGAVGAGGARRKAGAAGKRKTASKVVNVLTHCNTGALATGGMGTALAVVYVAVERRVKVHVWVDETRPLLQGSRLTAWELKKAGIPHTVQPDGAAASLLQTGKVDVVLVGADRVAKNGDTANKIGTYPLALAAKQHGVPLYVVAPSSSFDPKCRTGASIPIEQRAADEVSLTGSPAFNPAFDVTPAALISGWVTERGVLKPPFKA